MHDTSQHATVPKSFFAARLGFSRYIRGLEEVAHAQSQGAVAGAHEDRQNDQQQQGILPVHVWLLRDDNRCCGLAPTAQLLLMPVTVLFFSPRPL